MVQLTQPIHPELISEPEESSRKVRLKKVSIHGGGEGKRTHGHGQQCDRSRRMVGIRGLNGKGKNAIKFFKNSRLGILPGGKIKLWGSSSPYHVSH